MCIPSLVFCSDYTGHLSLTSGGLITDQKFSNAFNIDNKYEIGLSFDVKKKSWPISIAFDSSFLYAESETSENQYNVAVNKKVSFIRSDTCLGVKKIFNFSTFIKPFVSSGAYFVRIYGELSDNREIATGFGYWIGAGVYFDLSKNLTCGFLWKMSKADLNIFDVQSNVGGNHFSLTTGFHF
ncbi:MAG: hypothetical protein GY714_32475 [Desulfobacterales bacterium]|nr:hypothetical protein [Desulfobacterales bacterium]MCP4161735.1 hypothetical protein [Deltaproteobacteria bacterium]